MKLGPLLEGMPPAKLRLAGFGAMIVLLALLGRTTIVPQWREYTAMQESVRVLRQEMTTVAALEGGLLGLRAEVERLEHQLHGEASGLPVREVESFVLARLQDISWRQDMLLVGIRPGETRDVAGFKELLFEVELRGGYYGLTRWLDEATRDLGFVAIQRFDVSTVPADGPDPVLFVRLTLAAYRSAAS